MYTIVQPEYINLVNLTVPTVFVKDSTLYTIVQPEYINLVNLTVPTVFVKDRNSVYYCSTWIYESCQQN